MMLRKYGVWIALLLTLLACVWVTLQDESQPALEIVSAKQSSFIDKRQRAHKPISMRSSGLLSNSALPRNAGKLVLRSADLSLPVDLFSALVINASGAEAPENTIPAAPANPYIYAGKISDDGVWTIFLTDGSQNFAVKAGESLQGGWRLKHIQNQSLTLLYEPMKQEVKLDIGVAL